MTVKTAKLAVLAPDYLRPELCAILGSAAKMRDAMATGELIVSADVDTVRADGIVVIAPALTRLVELLHGEGDAWPFSLSTASHRLARFARAAIRADASVISEQDLLTRPDHARQAIAERIGLSCDAESDMEAPTEDQGSTPAEFPPEIQPIQIYGTLPVPSGVQTWWPYSVFLAHGGQCPPAIDITGRPRIFFCGPHIVLPPGQWRADLVFDLETRPFMTISSRSERREAFPGFSTGLKTRDGKW